MFNYATGPVEMDPDHRAAMLSGPVNSHSTGGQLAISELLDSLRALLELPDEFDLVLLPGSIRQALHDVFTELVVPGARTLSLDTGYWGGLIGDLVEAAGGEVERTGSLLNHTTAHDVVTAVHMETETGLMEPLESLARLRELGAITVVDAACTLPVHKLDYAATDVVVLGSHKCLAGPPGLGIVAIRQGVPTTRWPLAAYREDARARRQGSPQPAPLVTYPLELVLGLGAAVSALAADPEYAERRARAARHLRTALAERRLDVTVGSRASSTVTRLDLPAYIDTDRLRESLAGHGYFVIGNVGNSSGGSIRIGTMSAPQVELANLDRLVAALDAALAEQQPVPERGVAEHV